MSIFLHHEACPKCGSKDNLGVWADGHKWCFGCHYYESGESSLNYNILRERVNYNNEKPTKQVDLPADFDYTIPLVALDWLMSYDINQREITINHIGYSPSNDWLVFPIYGIDRELLAWVARNFGTKHRTKYYLQGDMQSILHILGHGNVLVLTEDIVSALKVSQNNSSDAYLREPCF